MERLQLNALHRDKVTKGQLKQLRREGYVPGVIYGHGGACKNVSVDNKQLYSALHTTAGNNIILDVNFDDENAKETVMVKDTQRELFHPENLVHVDLIRISLDEKVDVAIPVHLIGEPAAVKEGGVLQIQAREVNICSLPTNIPEYIEADISTLQFGESLLLKDLSLSEEVEILDDPETVIVSILAPTLVEETEEAGTDKDEAEGTEEEANEETAGDNNGEE